MTTATIVRLPEVSGPTATPTGSSVLDHATDKVITGAFGLRNPEGLFQSFSTGSFVVSPDFCAPEDVNFGSAPWADAFAFALQQGWKCSAVGTDLAEMERSAVAAFGNSEGRGVEQALLLAITTNEFGAPVDLVPSGTATLVQALARLEGSAAATYGGAPTIHMSRYAASLLGDRIVWTGGKAYTYSGSKVAIGGGYDVETPGATTEMYATGEVYVEMSDEIVFSAPTVPGDGSVAAGLFDNTVVAMVERLYRVALDPIRDDAVVLNATATV